MKNAITSVTMQPKITSTAAEAVVAFRDALLDDGRLQVELHPWRDGGADQADDHRRDSRGRGLNWGTMVSVERGFPVGMGEECGNRVGEIDAAKDQQHAFDGFVGAADDHRPDERGAERERR